MFFLVLVLKIVVSLQREKRGTIAQLVEQRTENPCVAGSIPAGTTSRAGRKFGSYFFHYLLTIQ